MKTGFKRTVCFVLLFLFVFTSMLVIPVSAVDNTAWYQARFGQRLADFNSYGYSSSYNSSSKGQCVWYVRGRAYEKLGVNTGISGNANTWYNSAVAKGLSTGWEIKSNSIACYNGNTYGHVIFVEWVDGDTVYFTEANKSGKNSNSYSSDDGVLQKNTKAYLRGRISGSYQGCIYLSNNTPAPSYELDTRYPTPFKAYTLSTSKVTCYNAINGSSPGYIYPTDECTIQEVYTNGWCKVLCPWTGYTNGRTVYVQLSAFLNTGYTPSKTVVSSQTVTYTRSNAATSYGYIGAGDTVTKVGSSGAYTQVIYPLSKGGYKCGWAILPVSSLEKPKLTVSASTLGATSGNYIKGESIKLTWNSVANATSYWLSVVYAENGDVGIINQNIGNVTSYTFTPQEDGFYWLILKAVNGSVTSEVGYEFRVRSIKGLFWISESAMGEKTTQILAGEYAYLCYKLFDGATEDLLYSYYKNDFPITLSIKDPSGTTVATQTFQHSDYNYIRYKCTTAGTYQTEYGATSQKYNGSFTVTNPTYTISYDANGGTGAPSAQTKTYNVPLTLSSIKPTRTGYIFLGWATSASTTTTEYQPGGTFTANANTTLYAVWVDQCASGHDYTYQVTSAPTTSTSGTLAGSCSRCGNTTAIALPKLNATDYTYSVTRAATCRETGTGRYTWKTTTYGAFYFDETIAKTSHSYKDTVTAPTCTEPGYTNHTCSECGNSYRDSETPALDHAWDGGKVTKQPTETETGVKTFSCTRCGKTKAEVIPVTGHVHHYSEEVIAPTCLAQGYTIHTCSGCGDSYKDNDVAALGHSYGDWKETKAASCTEPGSEQRVCSRCDAQETKQIEALGHNFKSDVTAPTCTEPGYAVHTCSRCNDNYVDSYIDALGHAYSYGVTAGPSVERSGTLTGACGRCGGNVSVSLPKLNDTDYSYQLSKAASCTERGSGIFTWKTTTYGVYSFEVPTDMVPHSYVEAVTAPTCTGYGYTSHTCSVCGDSYKDTYTAALGHSWDNGTVSKEPTETDSGVRTYTCTRCGETGTEAIPPLAHEHEFGATIVPPTCTQMGHTYYLCSCGVSYIDDQTAALGHDWDGGVVTTEPSEDAPGVRTYTCSRCGAERVESIPPLDHVHRYSATVVPPACIEDGYTIYTCEKCGDSYKADETDALGHDWNAGIVTVEPTQESEGVKTFTCARCGETRNEEIPKLDPSDLPCDGGDNCPGKVFADMPAKDNWAHDAIDWAVVKNVTTGTSPTAFSPGMNCSRAQVVTFLWRAAGEPEPEAAAPFTDVSADSWYAKAVAWAVEEGITAGTGGNKFSPDMSCSRAQIVTFLWRFEHSPEPVSTFNPFADVAPGAYYEKAVVWAAENGITSGTSATAFSPDVTCTRAQVVTFLYRDLV